MTVDVVVLTVRAGELCALVVRRGEAPYKGRWALPGGIVADGEDLVDAARRELVEETSVSPASVRLEQLATYGAPGRDPRRRTVSVAWLAVLPRPAVPEGGTHRARATWRPTEWLLGRGRLAFDHRTILRDGVERARAKLEYTNIATAFLEPEFTIAQLRAVYEVVWGHPLDAGNFHRKVTKTDGFVSPTGRRQSAGRGRPAELFTVGTEESLYPPLTRRSLA
ncbi:NUDIX hydrolase [Nocardioides panacis]|uniref:NUDIX hydrolase n=1 Tax=Nocardioides panacis TaxID=2849501 RepID=A0A975T2P0_9ACTN|nr:NUDIX hydrolase [Nocardioides panacis]